MRGLFLSQIGNAVLFFGTACVDGAVEWRRVGMQTLKQILNVGFFSLPLLGVTACFSGIVFSLQMYNGFSQFGVEDEYVPLVVSLSFVRELGPVLTGLLMAGRCGSAMAAELGTMRVTEQIDALRSLCIRPMGYLVFPRMLASFLVFPFVSTVFCVVGMTGGAFAAQALLGADAHRFLIESFSALKTIDWSTSMLKSAVFGVLMSWMGCYWGMKARSSAQGVGLAVTQTVVSSSILILLANIILTMLFLKKFS